jgi:succinoglycan biosynthesis transport protein ExoP
MQSSQSNRPPRGGTNGSSPATDVPLNGTTPPNPSSENYGYNGYGGYGGYGYGSGEGATVQRTIQDYLQILRERMWYAIVAFVLVVAATTIYTMSRVPIYAGTATVQIFRRAATVLQVQQVTDSAVVSAEDLNTQINLLKSRAIIDLVASKITGSDLEHFIAPYAKTAQSSTFDLAKVLERDRTVIPQRLSLIVSVEYRHPDREVAVKVANLFAEEFINYTARTRIDDSLKAVSELEIRATEQSRKVDLVAKAIQSYREKNNLVSLDQRKDIVTQKLKELSLYVTQGSSALQDAETRWGQVRAVRAKGEDLLNLPFVASVPTVSLLQQKVAELRIAVAQLAQRYKPMHPKMAEAMNSLKEGERQLKASIETTTAQVEANYETTRHNLEQAKAALAAQEADSLALDRYGVDYANLERDYEVNEKLLQHVLSRMQETAMSGSVEKQSARLVDRAILAKRPVSPNYLLNFALGTFGGIILGVGLAFFAAHVDDRVKSSYDIEGVIGIPLLSVIPKFKKKNADARDPVPGDDPEMAEAFSTLYSSLRLKDGTHPVQCMVVTSTIPSEGKSLIARNMAMTMASHGERVLLLDCDLRRPTLHRALNIENVKGVIDICNSNAALEDVIVKDYQPNLDVVPAGGRSKNPAQTLTSRQFELMIASARKKYDRIIIDTPPVGLVSDAFLILPLTDGAVYSIYFNKVRRKAAQVCVQRLRDINIPHLGAVLNGLDRDIGGYYYHQYYDKSYKQYYVTAEKDDDPNEPARR